jgi:hypothetical protein
MIAFVAASGSKSSPSSAWWAMAPSSSMGAARLSDSTLTFGETSPRAIASRMNIVEKPRI